MQVLKDMNEMETITVRGLINNSTSFNITTDDTESVFAQHKTTMKVYKVDVKDYELLSSILCELGIGYEYLDENILNDICEIYDY